MTTITETLKALAGLPAVTFHGPSIYLHAGFWIALAGHAVVFVLALVAGYYFIR